MNNNFTDILLNHFLQQNAKLFPDKIAVIHQNNRLNYSDLDKLSDIVALRLINNGLIKGDRVAIFIDNSCEYIISYFAVLKAGGVIVALNTQSVVRDLKFFINDCSAKIILTVNAHLKIINNVIETFTEKPIVSIVDMHIINIQSSSQSIQFNNISENDLAMIIYTSGTTGKSKGVMLSHKNLISNAESIISYLNLTSKDSVMVILPFYYSYGNSLLTTHIRVGGTLVIDNRFLYPNVILDAMMKEGVTGFAGVPSNYAILLKKSAIHSYKFPKLRYVTQAGGAMSPVMIKEFLEIMPYVKFYVMYGQTEASARLTYLPPEFLNIKIGSIGRAIPDVEINILDENGNKTKIGEIGEITAKGKNIMMGYWSSEEETQRVLKNNILYTGDLARMDDDGFIYIVSRKKDMIKCGANRISPFEIEDVALTMPGIIESAAIGIPDEVLGEAIKLYVVLNEGSQLTEKEILIFCKQNLASYKIPKQIEIRTFLPKTASGKIKREELRNIE